MQKLGVKLRRFEETDARDVSDMVRRGHLAGDAPGSSRLEIDDLYMQHGQTWAINEAKNNYMFVLTMQDEQVQDIERIEGCGAIGIEDTDPQTGRITDLSVMPEYRSMGLGRMILETLEMVARELNLTKVELQTTALSCGFYEILGYDCSEEEPEYTETGLYRMEKVLSEG